MLPIPFCILYICYVYDTKLLIGFNSFPINSDLEVK